MESKNYKLIPFDIQRAKTPSNPNGLEVVTEDNISVRIICTDRCYEYPIVGLVRSDSEVECVNSYKKNGLAYPGDVCLCLKEPVKPRRMTEQELSWWLREHPEEHRELSRGRDDGTVFTSFAYNDNRCDDEVPEDYRIRTHGGEWKEPLIEVEDVKLPF